MFRHIFGRNSLIVVLYGNDDFPIISLFLDAQLVLYRIIHSVAFRKGSDIEF